MNTDKKGKGSAQPVCWFGIPFGSVDFLSVFFRFIRG
jgi:hypothetical protein